MPLTVHEIPAPDPTRATLCLYGNAGLGKTQCGLGMAAGGASVLILSGEQAGGLTGSVADLRSASDLDDAVALLRKGQYQCVLADGLEKIFQLGYDGLAAGQTVMFQGRSFRAQSTRDPRMIYGEAGKWLDAVTQALHALPILTVFTTHARTFEQDWVVGKGRTLVASSIEISVDLPPASRAFMEEKVDFLLYTTMPPSSAQSVAIARHVFRKGNARIMTEGGEAITVTKKINAKHRFGDFPAALPLSWDALAEAIGLHAQTLMALPMQASQEA